MKKNEDLVSYGEKDVFNCISIKAVDTLLISDHLFRTKDFKKRRIYNDVAEDVKKFGTGQRARNSQRWRHIHGDQNRYRVTIDV